MSGAPEPPLTGTSSTGPAPGRPVAPLLEGRTPDLSDVEAVLFDMDGTLVDSHAAVERAWSTWSHEHGVPVSLALDLAHGGSAEDTVRRLLPHLGPSQVSASAARQLWLQYQDVADVRPVPGALESIEALQDAQVPWAVVTNADRRLAQARLGAAGIRPPVLVTVEDVAAGKPDPAGYLRAARDVGVDPLHCLAVEDSAPGVMAARAARMRVAALGGVEADLPLRDLLQLRDLVVSVRPASRLRT